MKPYSRMIFHEVGKGMTGKSFLSNDTRRAVDELCLTGYRFPALRSSLESANFFHARQTRERILL